ncbi:MAG: hypothetical protein HY671_13765 [Chloroflexi bacterium]|nr:hypothetical protein [Chloroflexota bacterium]
MINVIEAEAVIDGLTFREVGAEYPLTASISAYIVFKREPPSTLFFGVAKEAFSHDVNGWFFEIPAAAG